MLEQSRQQSSDGGTIVAESPAQCSLESGSGPQVKESSLRPLPQQSERLPQEIDYDNSSSSTLAINLTTGAQQASGGLGPQADDLSLYLPNDAQTALSTNSNWLDASLGFPSEPDSFFGMDMDFDQFLSIPTLEFLQSMQNIREGEPQSPTGPMLLQTMMSALELPGQLHGLTRSWLMLPSIPQRYDLELIELLVSVGQRHLSTIFHSFSGQPFDKHTLSVQVIAVAALGALFSECPESYDVGRWLFTDSIRMLDDSLFRSESLSPGATESMLRTMMALELFGLCSGHTRSHEVSEAYHQALIHTLTEFRHLSRSTSSSPQESGRVYKTFHHDVLILEAYRMTLLQLQPLCAPEHFTTMCDLLVPLSGLDHAADSSDFESSLSPYHQLARISVFSYFTFAYPEQHTSIKCEQNWRPETIEVYMQRFAIDNAVALERMPSLEILLRTNLWIMRSPVDTFHQAAYEIVQKEYTESDRWSKFFSKWRTNPSYEIMLHHIGRVLDRAEELTSPNSDFVETPHDALSTYLGTLALCVSQIGALDCPDERSKVARQIGRGIKIVSGFRLSLADGMRRILSLVFERATCQ